MDAAELNKLIDDYIMERLDDQSKADFENRLRNDVPLQEALALRKTMIGQLKILGDLEMKERILQIQNRIEKPAESKKSNRRIMPFLAIAAILLFLVVFYFILKPDPAPNYFANYYEVYDLPFGTRDGDVDTRLYDAGRAYQLGDYKTAISSLETIREQGINDDRIPFAMAISHLELAQFEEAKAILESQITNESFLYHEQALWYLALVYLKLNRTEDAKNLLQRVLINEESIYHTKAKELLQKLD